MAIRKSLGEEAYTTFLPIYSCTVAFMNCHCNVISFFKESASAAKYKDYMGIPGDAS